MSFRFIVLLILSLHLLSCAEIVVKEGSPFSMNGRDYLYKKKEWLFSGRLAVSGPDNSLSASIVWDHHEDRDDIELSGAFGQGRTRIELSEDKMIIDDGDERLQYVGDVDELVSELLGMVVPVSALRFWVRGIVFPKTDYIQVEKGFIQSGWNIKYLQMQIIGKDDLPRKIKIEKEQSMLKLVINQWQ